MNLDRALQYNTAALAVMGALFLGLGHQSAALPVALALAAIVSVGLSHRFVWMRLNRLMANLAALAAVCWSMRSFFAGVGTEEQLLAVADMLVYLQIVLLFQEKSGRVYWQLIVLSLLQVVVAAALNLGPHFGLLLVLYMITALTGLVLLCSYRESRKVWHARHRAARNGRLGRLAGRTGGPSSARGRSNRCGCRKGRRRSARGTARRSNSRFRRGLFLCGAPPSRRLMGGSARGNHASSGFTTQIALEEFGRIHLSNQLVMRVKLTEADTGQPYHLLGDPYFHGLALTDYLYDQAGARWVAGRLPRTAKIMPASPPERSTPVSNLVRQDFMLEGGSHNLYAILPIAALQNGAAELTMTPISNRIVRVGNTDDQRVQREFQFSVATSGLRNGRQVPRRPPSQSQNHRR